jgi:hypothetical protein
MFVVPAPGVGDAEAGIEAIWTFVNDGELVATGGIPPSVIAGYELPGFEINEKALADFEAELVDVENQGYKLAGVESFSRHLQALNYAPQQLSTVFDGTWQPDDTYNVWRWMGISVAHWERDNEVRTGNVRSHQELQLAETLESHAQAQGLDTADEKAKIKNGWRHQVFAEVTDATGWSPAEIEVNYGLNESEDALEAAQTVIASLKSKLGLDLAKIDTRAGSVEAAEEEGDENYPEIEPPVSATIVVSPTWSFQEKYYKISEEQTLVEIVFTPGAGAEAGKDFLRVEFPRTIERLIVSPALTYGLVQDEPLADFTFEHFHHALPNGLIGLGENLFVVEDTKYVHIAGRISKSEAAIVFEDQSMQPLETTWRFILVQGDVQKALDVAEAVNYFPIGIR